MRLVLTSEQSRKLTSATGNVEVVDSTGHVFGEFTLTDLTNAETRTLSADELEEVRRLIKDGGAESETSYTAHQVLD
jgi:hypothetical protein